MGMNIQSNIGGIGRLMSQKETMAAKVAFQEREYGEIKGMADCAEQQIHHMSEMEQAFTELSRRLDYLEVSLSGLANRLEPVLQLDRPQANPAVNSTDAPAYAGSKVGQGVLGAAIRVANASNRIDSILDLLAV